MIGIFYLFFSLNALFAFLANADFAFVSHIETDFGRLATGRAKNHDIGIVNFLIDLDNTTLWGFSRWFHVLLGQSDTFDDDALLCREYALDRAGLAFVFASDHNYIVIFL